MLSEFCVDIWFCYGSFSYGVESEVCSFGEDELALSLRTHDLEQAKQLDDFLEQIIAKPKGLLRVELRIYGPEKIFKNYNMTGPVYLYTEMAPQQVLSNECEEHLRGASLLKFVAIKGISPTNSVFWDTLVHRIWV